MKKRLALVLAGLAVAGVAAGAQADDRHDRDAQRPPPRHSPRGQPYVILHGGVFEPNDSRDGLSGYDSGWNFGGGIGSRVGAVFAVEGMVGVHTAERGPDEVQVIPVTVGGRFIIPTPFIEPYLGGGLGLYFAHLKEAADPPDFSGIDDSSATVGGYLSMGVDAWMNPRLALNFEGSYHFANASFESEAGNSFDVDVGGWNVDVGVRLEF